MTIFAVDAQRVACLSLCLMAAVAATLLPGRSAAAEIPASVVPEAPATVQDQVPPVVKLRAEPFRLEDVRLLDGPFKHAMELDRKYLLSLDRGSLAARLPAQCRLALHGEAVRRVGGSREPGARRVRRPVPLGLCGDVCQHGRRTGEGEDRPDRGGPGRVPGEVRQRLRAGPSRHLHRPGRGAFGVVVPDPQAAGRPARRA